MTVPTGLISRGPWTRSSSRWARLGRACFLLDIPPMRLNQFTLLALRRRRRRSSRRRSGSRRLERSPSWIHLLLFSHGKVTESKADNVVSRDVVDGTTAVDDVAAMSRISPRPACLFFLSLSLFLDLLVESRKNATTAVRVLHRR